MASALGGNERNLVVPVNASPIVEIEISYDLSTLKVKIDPPPDEDAPYKARSEVISAFGLKSIIGVGSGSEDICQVSYCKSIKTLHETGNHSEADELSKKGYVHTIQYPIDSLKFKGYINETQAKQISEYISNQMPLFRKPEENEANQKIGIKFCTLL